MQSYDVIVIGGGQAGLAMAYYLKKEGYRFLILEASDKAVGSWAKYYDSLRLFSPAAYSSLPDYPFPTKPDHYPHRDEVIAYLEAYAQHFQFPIHTNTRVDSVEKHDGLFQIFTNRGVYQAQALVAATGSFSHPNIPQYPQQSDFKGTIIHSSQYQSPQSFEGKRVVVVGAGNSAVQIAYELAQHTQTSIASLKPIQFRQQITFGQDLHFWLKWTGIDYFPHILWTKIVQKVLLKVGVLDTGKYQAAIKVGKLDTRPMFKAFTPDGIIWQDAQEEKVDAVIYATGFSPNLPYLEGLGALDDAGNPYQVLGRSTTVDGLFYMGLSNQVSIASATLRGSGRDGKLIISRINRFFEGKTCCHEETIRQWFKRLMPA